MVGHPGQTQVQVGEGQSLDGGQHDEVRGGFGDGEEPFDPGAVAQRRRVVEYAVQVAVRHHR
jgi:hypothetical protein